MNVLELSSRRRHTEPEPMDPMPASIIPDDVLRELLRLAIVDFSQASDHVPGPRRPGTAGTSPQGSMIFTPLPNEVDARMILAAAGAYPTSREAS